MRLSNRRIHENFKIKEIQCFSFRLLPNADSAREIKSVFIGEAITSTDAQMQMIDMKRQWVSVVFFSFMVYIKTPNKDAVLF